MAENCRRDQARSAGELPRPVGGEKVRAIGVELGEFATRLYAIGASTDGNS